MFIPNPNTISFNHKSTTAVRPSRHLFIHFRPCTATDQTALVIYCQRQGGKYKRLFYLEWDRMMTNECVEMKWNSI